MLQFILVLCVFYQFESIYLYAYRVAGPKYPATQGELWPKPQYQIKQDIYYTFSQNLFSFVVPNHTCPILDKYLKRVLNAVKDLELIARRNVPSNFVRNTSRPFFSGHINALTVVLTEPCEDLPHDDMDEKYELYVSANSMLNSASIWGAIRGLESFSQMFYIADADVRINATQVIDFPLYKYRGILLDTGRHYLSMSTIFTMLDAMAMNKFNVFHWHMSDDESFPYASTKLPKLSEKGAFHYTMVYSNKDIHRIIEYARDRGIRVIPEFDIPGHVLSWGNAYPEILTTCGDENPGPLNPILNKTYVILKELFSEVRNVFLDEYLHLGGDEIDQSCWISNPKIINYLNENNLTTSDLGPMFFNNTMRSLPKKTKVIVWQDLFDEGVTLPDDAMVQVWRYGFVNEMIKILQAGKKVIFSSSWYLDYLNYDFSFLYDADPRQMVNGQVNLSLALNIVGGEACMWGEKADDTNIISRVWGRACAVAEVLWHDTYAENESSNKNLYNRLEEHTCRMRRRGVNAEPVLGPSFCFL